MKQHYIILVQGMENVRSDNMKYYAHKSEDGKRLQTVREHSENVMKLCGKFSKEEFKELAMCCGIGHDIGKCCREFAKRLDGENISAEHSIAGAKEIRKRYTDMYTSWIAAFCIAGHHTGLPDGGTKTDDEEQPTLSGRLKRQVNYSDNEVELLTPMTNEDFQKLIMHNIKTDNKIDVFDIVECAAFITRYIYSCLVDADFIDTENFFADNKSKRKSVNVDFNLCNKLLSDKLSAFSQDTPIKAARNDYLNEVKENIREDAQIYLMNMPTGSGKTLCSMKAALERIEISEQKNLDGKRKRRIIYVIPYNTIVEQTVKVFEDVFNHQPILQHSSNFYYETKEDSQTNDDDDNMKMIKQLKLASENWDADLIVTTNVQFFESVYHYKSSRMRKIHNMADSIIVFDEIHMMPKEYLYPCIQAIGYITKLLNSEAIFLTATMPDFKILFDKIIPFCKVKRLIENQKSDIFKKCDYKYRGVISDEKLIEEALESDSTLIVVNKRGKAKEIYKKLKEFANKELFIYHLSTYMTGYDRSRVIKEIGERLKNNEKTILISTSLIEAGVDLDFSRAYREISGIDSILQTGGRCNREGLKDGCSVNIYEFEGSVLKRDLSERANITKALINKFEDISSDECIREYYRRYYDDIENIRKQSIIRNENIEHISKMPFREYSDKFKFINSETVEIIINKYDECKKDVEKLRNGDKSAAKKLRKYSASVYLYEFKQLLEQGLVSDYGTGMYVLTNLDYYDENIGISYKFEDIEYMA